MSERLGTSPCSKEQASSSPIGGGYGSGMSTRGNDWEDSTERLELHRPVRGDISGLYEILSDSRVWGHYPSQRHTSPEQTEASVQRWIAGWNEVGLGTWVARACGDAQIVGYGGCTVRHGAAWNLGYRLAVHAQGRGLATELARRALERATGADPHLPVIAYLLEHNKASAAVAKKLGMSLAYRGPDTANPDAAAIRLIYADRPLTDEQRRRDGTDYEDRHGYESRTRGLDGQLDAM